MRILVVLSVILLSALRAYAADHAVILLYHHVSETTPPSTSISPQLFRQHLDYLAREGFQVLPLSRVLQTLAENGEVPDKTVCITFDDGYRSVFDQAMPLLQERGWPFTVFVSTDAIDKGYADYLNWDNLRHLVAAGAEIGNHSRTHAHLVRRLDGETDDQWRGRVAGDIGYAGDRIRSELGANLPLFAYPYGEHIPELRELVASLGYFGISQQSGAVGPDFARQAVPRFPMATRYDDMNRFALSVNARPLPVSHVAAGPPIQVAGNMQDRFFSFVLAPGPYRLSALACYSGSGERLQSETEEEGAGSRITVTLPDWGAGRRKVNCTAPSGQSEGIYYWYSQLWLVKNADGSWYNE